jgi:hypothetical protein
LSQTNAHVKWAIKESLPKCLFVDVFGKVVQQAERLSMM